MFFFSSALDSSLSYQLKRKEKRFVVLLLLCFLLLLFGVCVCVLLLLFFLSFCVFFLLFFSYSFGMDTIIIFFVFFCSVDFCQRCGFLFCFSFVVQSGWYIARSPSPWQFQKQIKIIGMVWNKINLSVSVWLSVSLRPDVTVMVDWA